MKRQHVMFVTLVAVIAAMATAEARADVRRERVLQRGTDPVTGAEVSVSQGEAGLVAIEVRGAEPLSRSLDVIHPRQRPLSPEALALLRILRQAVGPSVRAALPGRRRR